MARENSLASNAQLTSHKMRYLAGVSLAKEMTEMIALMTEEIEIVLMTEIAEEGMILTEEKEMIAEEEMILEEEIVLMTEVAEEEMILEEGKEEVVIMKMTEEMIEEIVLMPEIAEEEMMKEI